MEFIKKLLSAEIITSIVLAILVIVIYLLVSKAYEKRTHKKTDGGIAITVVRVIYSIIRAAIVVFGVLIILQVNGINISGMVAGLGIASAIVGLALQDYLKDVIMGIHILADRFFMVGDFVEFDGEDCEVIGVTLKTTKLRIDADNSIISICNREITRIRKLSDCISLNLPVSYEEDFKKVDDCLSGICKTVGNIEGIEKCENRGINKFCDSCVEFRILMYTHKKTRNQLRRDALRVIIDGLAANGIYIPYNKLDVNFIKKD